MTRTEFLALINTLGSGDKNTALEVRTIFNAFADAAALTGDVKEVDCDNTYLALNFDNTGLGVNERVGWAICNGLNGTRDRNGRVGIGYGSDYTTIGLPGGSKDAVVVNHTHTVGIKKHTNSGGTIGLFDQATGGVNENFTSSGPSNGVSGANKNMQPYIVSLFIQKL
jgi:hypothetical protein